jgi:predicted NodU family carbamoyl transferase
MGLAPYGRPSAMDAMRKIVLLQPDGTFELDLAYFRHHRERVAYQWTAGSPEFGDLFSPALEELLGPRRDPADPLEDRHRDIARSAQAMYEAAFFHLLVKLQRRSGLTDIALAGGCAMNSVANGGNRSIVCDPRRADMKAILNAKIKRRESFRPFAPSVLEESVSGWFEEDDAVPFMMQVFQIREEKRSLIPAVTHVDGSGRLQTVSAKTNPLYHRLITSFRDLTGVPMVLNTSFNENEPVVCKPEQALDCFLRTTMDTLVIGNSFISRRSDVPQDLGQDQEGERVG